MIQIVRGFFKQWPGSLFQTEENGHGSIFAGTLSITTTANAMPNNPCKLVTLLSDIDTNTINIWVGGSNLTNTAGSISNGFKLVPGQSLPLAITNTNLIYLVVATGGPATLYFLGLN